MSDLGACPGLASGRARGAFEVETKNSEKAMEIDHRRRATPYVSVIPVRPDGPCDAAQPVARRPERGDTPYTGRLLGSRE